MFQTYIKFLKNIFGFIVDGVIPRCATCCPSVPRIKSTFLCDMYLFMHNTRNKCADLKEGEYLLNTQDLMNRYKISKSGIRLFINRNLSKINADGIEHAKQTSEGWLFDAEAVRIIDELRSFSQVSVIEQEETERIKELQNEIENLKNLLLISQSQLIKVQSDLNETQKLLQDNQTKLLTAENQSKENDMALVRTQADLKIEKSKREIAEEKILEINFQLDESQRQFEKIKNRGLIDRILNSL